jgi:hypothetical protein
LVQFVNFAGAKVKNFFLKVSAVSLRNAPLRNEVSRLVSMDALGAVAVEAAQANPIICDSYAPSSALVVYTVF